jgi:uncharacterized protein YggE
MKRPSLIAAAALAAIPLAAAPFQPALAQTDIVPSIAAGHTLLTVNAQGSSRRTPDMAAFSAGVTTQGQTASEAFSANSGKMNQVMAALRKAGIDPRDIQTSNLNLNPVYSQPKRLPDGSYDGEARVIVGYEATNNVTVRQRKLGDMGKVIDALVGAGANQVNGPSFMLSEPDAAEDEARIEAMKKARARADLYARAAGLRVARIVTISESGGYAPMPPMVMRMDAMKASCGR